MQTKAWLFDVEAVDNGVNTCWITTDHKHLIKAFFPLYAEFYLTTADRRIQYQVSQHPQVQSTSIQYRYISIHDHQPSPVLRVFLNPKKVRKTYFDLRKHWEDYLYNVDLSIWQYFSFQTELFPFAYATIKINEKNVLVDWKLIEKYEELHYQSIPFKAVWVVPFFKKRASSQGSIKRIKFQFTNDENNIVEFENGSEYDILTDAFSFLKRIDPDVILTIGGDKWWPQIAERACRYGLHKQTIGRSTRTMGQLVRHKVEGISFASYGRAYYSQKGIYLNNGCHHHDVGNSFSFKDGKMEGVVELSRLSCCDPQRIARATIGTALTSVQLKTAYEKGILIPRRKADAEDFRSGSSLASDVGGLVFSPQVGLHLNVTELDFLSMYPNIMVKKNISPETINCSCCTENKVPNTEYNICTYRDGIVKEGIKHVLERREHYKKHRKENIGYDQRQKVLKWLLVTCFDSTTKIPVKEQKSIRYVEIGPYIDEIIQGVTDLKKISLIGVNKDFHVIYNPVKNAFKLKSPNLLLKIKLENKAELTVTGDHLCFVLQDGKVIEKRADTLSRKDYLPVLTKFPDQKSNQHNTKQYNKPYVKGDLRFVKIVTIEKVPSTGDFVYCFEVENELPGFIAGKGNIFSHNCFGYQGYRNARFGRIEAHESISAYGRDALATIHHHATENHLTTIAGIVDSIWLKNSTETPIDPTIISSITKQTYDDTKLPVDNEGDYHWIVFLPRRHEENIGVLNRYYGFKKDGTFKVRGIEVRQSNSPRIVKRMQSEILLKLSKARSRQEFRAAITSSRKIVDSYCQRLLRGEVELSDLLITTRLSKEPKAYVNNIPQSIGAKQLSTIRDIQSGQNVTYIITNSKAKNPTHRVLIKEKISSFTTFDFTKYQELCFRAYNGMIPPEFQLKQRKISAFINI